MILVDDAPPVAVVTIDRPEAMNALDGAALQGILDTARALGARADVRCLVITGAGERAFAAGADLKALAGLAPADAERLSALGHDAFGAIEALDKPVIAAVNGVALGGGLELALACDFIVAAAGAKFGLPEVGLGLIPGFGGTQRLPRRVGDARARQLILTGDAIDADEALRIGLVAAVVPPERVLASALTYARKIATRAPLAVAAAKRAIREGLGGPTVYGLAGERAAFAALFGSADAREGVAAFFEKRSPRFSGR